MSETAVVEAPTLVRPRVDRRNQFTSSWTAERIEALQQLAVDGLMATDIAIALTAITPAAGPLTKNAVIGRIHRSGLPWTGSLARVGGAGRPRKPEDQRKPQEPRKPRVKKMPGFSFQRLPPELRPKPRPEPTPVLELLDFIIPVEQRCSLLDLDDTRCRWPVGEPGQADFFFCGGKPVPERPYCSHHCRLAYTWSVN